MKYKKQFLFVLLMFIGPAAFNIDVLFLLDITLY
jgi:hypothetical protein